MPFIFSFLLELLFFFKNMTNTQYPSQIRTKKTGLLGLWDSCLLSLLLLQQSWCHWCKKMNLGFKCTACHSKNSSPTPSHPLISKTHKTTEPSLEPVNIEKLQPKCWSLACHPISVEKHQPLRLHITWALSVANGSRQRQAITLHFSKRFSWMTQ